MKIRTILSQHRRDFTALYECEHCGVNVTIDGGYDDDYFHQTVIPNMKCKKCGKCAGEEYRALTTKYPADAVI